MDTLDYGSGKIISSTWLSVHILLQYDGTLAENTTVKVTAFGYLYPKGSNLITGMVNTENGNLEPQTIEVGFDGASLSNNPDSDGSFDLPLSNTPEIMRPTKSEIETHSPKESITWNTQGEYYPVISIPTNENGSPIVQSYTEDSIHVDGYDVVQQENFARITTVLTIVLLVFTFVTSIELLWKLLLGILKDHGIAENSTPDNTNRNA